MKVRIKKILILGFPLLAGRLSHYSHQVADSIMMGHFKDGSLELGALAIAGMFIWIVNTLLWPLGNGIQAIVTRRAGSRSELGKAENQGTVMDHGMLTAFLVSLIALGVSFLAKPLFDQIISEEKIIDLAMKYVRLLRFSFFPFGIQMIIQRFFNSIQKPKYGMIVSFISNGSNIILNYIFIYGKLGFPEMGISGAALGTVLSYWIGFLYMITIALKQEYISKYKFFHLRKIDRQLITNIIKQALPPAIQNMLAMLIMLFYEAMIENIGAIYLAATHVVFSAFRINKTIVGGFSHGTAILVGNQLGADNKEGAKSFVHACYVIGLIIGACVFITVFFFPQYIARIFVSSESAIETVTMALKFFAPFYLAEIIGFSFEMVFIGNGNGKFVLYSEFVTNIIFILGLTFINAQFWGGDIKIAWLGFGLYQVFHSTFLHIGFKTGRWANIDVETV
ncbi:MAG: MATE family efflux transporter [Spirochaetales bacterium]|nr:MATE family efflux transporter [Spirochaetales bacterium]